MVTMPSKSKKKLKKTKRKHWLQLKPFHVFFSLLILAILLSLSAYMVLSKPMKYEGLSNVESASGTLKISIPSSMEKNYVGDNIIDLEHRAGSNDSILSHVRAEAQHIDSKALKEQAPKISSQFQMGSGDFFEALTRQPLSQPSAANLSFSKFEHYDSGNIEGLLGGFSYLFDDTPVKGSMLIAFGDEEIYLVTIEATEEIWNKNTSVWEKVLESFEVADGR